MGVIQLMVNLVGITAFEFFRLMSMTLYTPPRK
jgi:hypothetical protein